MYWPTSVAKRLYLSPSGLHRLPVETAESAEPKLANGSSQSDGRSSTYTNGGRHGTSSEAHTALPAAESSSDAILRFARSRSGQHFVTLSPRTIAFWSTRPSIVIAALTRTDRSIREYGANRAVHMNPSEDTIVVETNSNYILLYALLFEPPSESQIYSYIPPRGSDSALGSSSKKKHALAPTPSALRNAFAAAPAENIGGSTSSGAGLVDGPTHPAYEIHFRLAIRIDAGLKCSVSTDTHLLVSTISPPALQSIPIPSRAASKANGPQEATSPTRTTLIRRLEWMAGGVRDEEGKSPVHVTGLIHSRPMSLFIWLTSDGRAYASDVHFDTRTAIWKGACFHGKVSESQLAALRRKRASTSVSAAGTATVESQKDSLQNEADLGSKSNLPTSPRSRTSSLLDDESQIVDNLPFEKRALSAAVNAKFSLVAVGQQDGIVQVYTILPPPPSDSANPPVLAPAASHTLSLRTSLRSTASYLVTGAVTALAWTSDGYAIAVMWEKGWAVWSTYGKLMTSSFRDDWDDTRSSKFSDEFMFGVQDAFWGPGNTELFVLSGRRPGVAFDPDGQLYTIPFAKSAVASQHSADNTRFAFVQTDDSVLVYRGEDQRDLSAVEPDADVWDWIKIPASYLAANWPIRHASISSDGQLIAVAGRRGLAHYSTLSQRWKTFSTAAQEQAFTVRGGLQWFQHVLIAAVDAGSGSYQLRLHSRDADLDNSTILHLENLPSPVIMCSLFDNSLLVYTADNTFLHFLIDVTPETVRLRMCASMTFEGVVGEPARVRGMSWLIPKRQQVHGDPMDDLTVATIIFLIDGKLVLLRPRKVANVERVEKEIDNDDDEDEVAYDLQILADQVEYYWTHLQGIGALENSLWGFDGEGINVWLDALTITRDDNSVNDGQLILEEYKTVKESVRIPLEVYPLSVLMDKGVIVGVESEISVRKSLEFVLFQSSTTTALFLQHVLRFYLNLNQLESALDFAAAYESLPYFSHALEILLNSVLEDDIDAGAPFETASESGRAVSPTTGPKQQPVALLPRVVDFLDYLPCAPAVVVGCARKTEVARWEYLFSVVGSPISLFHACMDRGDVRTAASYILVLHTLEPLEVCAHLTAKLLECAAEEGEWALCKELLDFVNSIDESGETLRHVVSESGLLDEGEDHSGSDTQTTPVRTSVPLPKADNPGALASTSSGLTSPAPTMSRGASSSSATSWLAGAHTPTPLAEMTDKGRIVPRRADSSSLLSPSSEGSTPGSPNSRGLGLGWPGSPSPRALASPGIPGSPGGLAALGRPDGSGLGRSLSRVGLRSAEKVSGDWSWGSKGGGAGGEAKKTEPPSEGQEAVAEENE